MTKPLDQLVCSPPSHISQWISWFVHSPLTYASGSAGLFTPPLTQAIGSAGLFTPPLT